MLKWRDATERRKRRGEIGEPWGAPMFTGAGVPQIPCKTRLQLRSLRKDETQETR